MNKIILILFIFTCCYSQHIKPVGDGRITGGGTGEVSQHPETTPPALVSGFKLIGLYNDTTRIRVEATSFAETVYLGFPADMDSFRITFQEDSYPTDQSDGTLLIAGNRSDTLLINNDSVYVDLTYDRLYYGVLWMADTLLNWNAGQTRVFTTANYNADIFQIYNLDTTKVKIITDVPSTTIDTFFVKYATYGFPTIYEGSTLIAGNDFDLINDDTINVDLSPNTIYFARLFLGVKATGDYTVGKAIFLTSATDAYRYNSVLFVEYLSPSILIAEADTNGIDSIDVILTGYVPGIGTISRTWIGHSDTLITSPDTSNYGDITYTANDSISSYTFAHTSADYDSVYIYAITQNSYDSLSTPKIHKLYIPDMYLTPTIASISVDTSGVQNATITLSGYDIGVVGGHIDSTWIGMSYSYIANPSRSDYGDSVYISADSVTTHEFTHTLSDNDTLFFYALAKNNYDSLSAWYSDSLVVPDMWSPVAGHLHQTIKPIGRDSLTIVSFGGVPDLTSVYLDIWSANDYVNVYSSSDSSITNTTINFAEFNISFQAQDSTLKSRLRLYDDEGNYSSAYDTTTADSSREVKMLADTSLTVIQNLRIYISADSNSTIIDSSYFEIAELDTAFVGDSLVAYIPSPTSTFWYAARPMIANTWGNKGKWYKYPK